MSEQKFPEHYVIPQPMIPSEIKPMPDPTILTTEQLLREINGVTALLRSELAALEKVRDSKFDAVAREFQLIEERRQEQKVDTKCVESSTPVLCADLIWRPAGLLRVGDELIGFDEEPAYESGSASGTTGRKFRRATVTANSIGADALFKVVTEKGAVVCNAEHPLLTRQRSGPKKQRWAWVEARDLQVGDEVLKPLDVWDVETTWEAGWLAGMYDGEGSLSFNRNVGSGDIGTPRMEMVQRDSPTGDRILSELIKRVPDLKQWHRTGHAQWNDRTQYVVTLRPDVMRILGSIRPPRLLEHADKVWDGTKIASKNRKARIVSITSIGFGDIAMLSTSTGTYIAGGFASHNTAVDAALAAAEKAFRDQTANQEKAIQKSETASIEQAKQQNATFTASLQAQADTLSDVKSRVGAIEARALGAAENRTQHQQNSTGMWAVVGGVGGLILLAIVILGFIEAYNGGGP